MSESVAVRIVKLKLEIKDRDKRIAQLEETLQEVRCFLEIHADGWPSSTGGWELWKKVRAALSRWGTPSARRSREDTGE